MGTGADTVNNGAPPPACAAVPLNIDRRAAASIPTVVCTTTRLAATLLGRGRKYVPPVGDDVSELGGACDSDGDTSRAAKAPSAAPHCSAPCELAPRGVPS